MTDARTLPRVALVLSDSDMHLLLRLLDDEQERIAPAADPAGLRPLTDLRYRVEDAHTRYTRKKGVCHG